MKVALLVVVCLVAGAFSAPSAHIDSALRRVLKAKGTANIFISFKGGNEPALNSLRRTTFATRDARLNGVAAALQSYSQRTQENVLAYLNKVHNAGVQSFWINNRIYVQNADSQLVESLALFPEISDIVEEEIIQLDPVLDAQYHSSKEGRPLNEWGVQKIQAPEAWGMDGGNSGEGVVVANIDTGVRYTHETLRSNFRGSDYGWFDPYTGSSNPIDQNGHGTVSYICMINLFKKFETKMFLIVIAHYGYHCWSQRNRSCSWSYLDCLPWLRYKFLQYQSPHRMRTVHGLSHFA